MRPSWPIAITGNLLLATQAQAHGLVPGPAGVYVAFVHTLTEIPAGLALVTLGLMLGLSSRLSIFWAWAGLMLGLPIGLLAILAWGVYVDPIRPLLIAACGVAVAAASGLEPPKHLAAPLGFCVGYLIGIVVAPGPASLSTQAFAISGSVIATNVAAGLPCALVFSLRARYRMPIISLAVRVISSWFAAVAALMIAVTVR